MTDKATALRALDEAIGIIDTADNRAMAADGPVGHVRDEMSDTEWRRLYVSLKTARAALAADAPAPEAGGCPSCRESASGVCTMHNGSFALALGRRRRVRPPRPQGDAVTPDRDALREALESADLGLFVIPWRLLR